MSIEYARTVAVNALVMVEVFYLYNCRLLSQSIFTRDFINGSKPMIIASFSVILFQLIYSYLPVSQRIFGLESISIDDWMLIVLVTGPVMVVVEIEKWFHRMIAGNNNNHVVQSAKQA